MEKKEHSKVKPMAKERWQIDVSDSVFVKGKGHGPGDGFLPTPGKIRPTPHVKINECDH